MTAQRIIWAIRHGLREDCHQKDWTRFTKFMVDPDLSDLGIEMALRLGRRIRQEPADHLVASPMLRTLHTAHFCAGPLKKKIKVEYGFHEVLDDRWFPQGVPVLPTLKERFERFPHLDFSYESCVIPTVMENDDNPDGCLNRVHQALEGILEKLDGNIMIITHYAIVNAIAMLLMGRYLDEFVELTSITKFVHEDGIWRAELAADASHLDGLI